MSLNAREVGIRHYAHVNPLTTEFNNLEDGTVVDFLPLENIWSTEGTDYSRKKAWKKSETSYTQFRRGDVLVPKVTPTVFHGRSIIANTKTDIGLATSEVHVLRPKENADARWIVYNLLSSKFLDRARGEVYGVGGLQRISAGYLGSYKLMETNVRTQRRIADYLDRETAEIDAAVADLDRYVELLEERRAALLIKETKIRDSVPLTNLGRHAQVFLGKTLQSEAKNDFDQLTSYVRAGNIQPNGVFAGEEKKMWMSPIEIETYSIEAGDVLVVEGGAGFGRSLTMERGLPGWGFQNHVIRIRPSAGWIGKFLDYSIRAHKADGLIDLIAIGATIPGFSSERAKKLPVAFLNQKEQLKIVQSLDEKNAEIDSLIAESTKLRDLLLKRRSVLITEVVTGRKEVQ
ncbi:type I restriction endonuclease subunit S [Corynebacterium sp. ES2775-CONJ]|uniref:restriction endonuclease subunit S n=1 Tax=Corynebacterium sp. ES2775-CONJ TaxID=2974029 RepID=UPI0021694C7D|nr:type I restriction endonuclease subunit S [Corynebacterium sp. ES2775-CONJ]MCS4489447.1 type I restriction endonuclease subunit S [Corynebacterium sp. ES2775-CONJ]